MSSETMTAATNLIAMRTKRTFNNPSKSQEDYNGATNSISSNPSIAAVAATRITTNKESVVNKKNHDSFIITDTHSSDIAKDDPSPQNHKIRLLYFFYRFSTASLIPFMSLYMQHTGWNSDQIGKLQSIRPIVTMLSAPLWGGLADRTGKRRLVLMVSGLHSQ